MLNIVLFGPPGAGKGTQSQKLIDQYQLVHLSTGDILRAERKAGTPLGNEAQSYIERGALVPDEVVIGMMALKIEQNQAAKGFIFDGFPRTVAQAKALDSLLETKKAPINVMIALEVDGEELKKRLLLRGKDSGRADDQDPEIIANRIKVYESETFPVAKYYEAQGKYAGVQGVGEIDQIFGQICQKIDPFLKDA